MSNYAMKPPRLQGFKGDDLQRPGASPTLVTIKGGSLGGMAVLRWTNPPAPAEGGRKKRLPPLDVASMEVTLEEVPSKVLPGGGNGEHGERELDAVALRRRLEALLELPATPEEPILIYYKERVQKNMDDIKSALEGLPVTHVGSIEGSTMARTMKVSFKPQGGQALLERAREVFPQVASELKNKTRHGRLAEALIVAAHVIGVQPTGPPLAVPADASPDLSAAAAAAAEPAEEAAGGEAAAAAAAAAGAAPPTPAPPAAGEPAPTGEAKKRPGRPRKAKVAADEEGEPAAKPARKSTKRAAPAAAPASAAPAAAAARPPVPWPPPGMDPLMLQQLQLAAALAAGKARGQGQRYHAVPAAPNPYLQQQWLAAASALGQLRPRPAPAAPGSPAAASGPGAAGIAGVAGWPAPGSPVSPLPLAARPGGLALPQLHPTGLLPAQLLQQAGGQRPGPAPSSSAAAGGASTVAATSAPPQPLPYPFPAGFFPPQVLQQALGAGVPQPSSSAPGAVSTAPGAPPAAAYPAGVMSPQQFQQAMAATGSAGARPMAAVGVSSPAQAGPQAGFPTLSLQQLQQVMAAAAKPVAARPLAPGAVGMAPGDALLPATTPGMTQLPLGVPPKGLLSPQALQQAVGAAGMPPLPAAPAAPAAPSPASVAPAGGLPEAQPQAPEQREEQQQQEHQQQQGEMVGVPLPPGVEQTMAEGEVGSGAAGAAEEQGATAVGEEGPASAGAEAEAVEVNGNAEEPEGKRQKKGSE